MGIGFIFEKEQMLRIKYGVVILQDLVQWILSRGISLGLKNADEYINMKLIRAKHLKGCDAKL